MIPVKQEPTEEDERTPRLADPRMLADAFRAPEMTMDYDSMEAQFDSRMRRAVKAYSGFLSHYGGESYVQLPYEFRNFRGFTWGRRNLADQSAMPQRAAKALLADPFLKNVLEMLGQQEAWDEMKELGQSFERLADDMQKFERENTRRRILEEKGAVTQWRAVRPREQSKVWDGSGTREVLVIVSPAPPPDAAVELISDLLPASMRFQITPFAEEMEHDNLLSCAIRLSLPSVAEAWSAASQIHRCVGCRVEGGEKSTLLCARWSCPESLTRTKTRSSRQPRGSPVGSPFRMTRRPAWPSPHSEAGAARSMVTPRG